MTNSQVGSPQVEIAVDPFQEDININSNLEKLEMFSSQISDRARAITRGSGTGIEASRSETETSEPGRLGRMGDELRAAMIESGSMDGKKFIPLDSLNRILSPFSVNRELEACCQLAKPDRETLVRRIFANPSCRRIFAILALVEQVEKMGIFIREGLSDSDLPLYGSHESRTGVKAGLLPRKLQDGWPEHLLEFFEDHQWEVLAPVFDFRFGRIIHYVLDDRVRLPFFVDEDSHDSSGGFSDVWRVRIHHTHHLTDTPASKQNNPPYAIKRIRNRSGTIFENEASALRRLSGSSTQHLIRLLATYEHRGAYHMIFPWAGGNLTQLWRANPQPNILSPSTATWFKDQLLGLAEGLGTIHQLETTDKSTASTTHGKPGRGEETRIYGRHGDLKPENILYFPEPSSSLSPADKVLGRLVISDFGLTAFMHARTSKNTIARTLARSPTYRPPETDIGNQLVSQRFDIWSLGCVLLEFASWMLAGWDSVLEFTIRRMEEDLEKGDDSFHIKEDKFFNAITGDLTGANESRHEPIGILKPVIIEWSNQLLAHANCTGYMHDLISLIMNTMLQVQPTHRITAENLFKTLSRMNSECSRDGSYFYRPGPGRNICHLYSHPSVYAAENSVSLFDPTITTSGEISTALVKQSADKYLPTSSRVSAEKRRKVVDPDSVPVAYSCPFRKRNPLRFNVREYQTCALSSFPDISQVKRHIQNVHGTPSCDFSEGTDHRFVVDDPESGLSVEAESKLRDRRTSHQVLDWDSLWTVLFPNDTMIPTGEYEPVVEDHEIHHRVTEVSDLFRNIFSTVKPAGLGIGYMENDVMPMAHVWPIIETVLAQHFEPRKTTSSSLRSASSLGRATVPANGRVGNRHTTRTRTKSTRNTTFSGARRNTQTGYEGNRHTTEPLRRLAPTPSLPLAQPMMFSDLKPFSQPADQCSEQAMPDGDPVGLSIASPSQNGASTQVPAPPAIKGSDNQIASSKRKFEEGFPELPTPGDVVVHTSQLGEFGEHDFDWNMEIPESVAWDEILNDQALLADLDIDTSLLDSHIGRPG